MIKEMKNNKKLCCHCLKSGKGFSWDCGKNGHSHIYVSDKIRFPSIKASKKEWQKILTVSPFNNEFHREQEGYSVLLKTIEGLK